MTRILTIESRVDKDGVLSLRVPLGPSDANSDVIVTIQPKPAPANPKPAKDWPPGYFEKTYGALANDPLEIPDDPVPALEGTG